MLCSTSDNLFYLSLATKREENILFAGVKRNIQTFNTTPRRGKIPLIKVNDQQISKLKFISLPYISRIARLLTGPWLMIFGI